MTTVRDESALGGPLSALLAWRDQLADDPRYARLVSAGVMIAVPGGYGSVFISAPAEARQLVDASVDQGADVIKLAMEDGYAGRQNLPKLTPAELATIIAAAHQRFGACHTGAISASRRQCRGGRCCCDWPPTERR